MAFLFNPSGFEWQKIVDDWTDWNKWISIRGGIGVLPEKSWESWWEEEQEHLQYSGMRGIIAEILLSLLSVWPCLSLEIYEKDKKFSGKSFTCVVPFFPTIYLTFIIWHIEWISFSWLQVYGISWLVIFLILFVMKVSSKLFCILWGLLKLFI